VSTELQRRLKVLEGRIGGATSCAHGPVMLVDPTEEEVDAAVEMLADCPNCAKPKFNQPTMLIVRLDGRIVNPLDLTPTTNGAVDESDA
jgi:hypothetical protein